MLKRFEESFERCMAQVEAWAPRECSKSPLGSSSSRLRRSDDFSSQEDSVADVDGRLASVVRTLSPGAAQASSKIVLGKDSTDGLLTISLGAGDERSASRAGSPVCLETSDVESCCRKRKRDKKKKKKQQRCSPSFSSESEGNKAPQAEKSARQRGVLYLSVPGGACQHRGRLLRC